MVNSEELIGTVIIRRHKRGVVITEEYNITVNLLKTKRNLLYIRYQSVPRCKHFPPRL
jgi:hypothetical protein